MATTTSASTSASSTLTATPAREAAQACLEAAQGLAPSVPSSTIHRHVHRAAQALQAALGAGATLREILDALVTLTAPAVPEPPLVVPWAPLLPLSLDAFADSGCALGVAYPALQVSTWWCGPEAVARQIARERRLTLNEIWRLVRLQQEAARAGLNPETVTIEQLITALGGEIKDWRPRVA